MKDYIPGITHFFEWAHLKVIMVLSIGFTSIQAIADQYLFTHTGWVEAIAILVIADTLGGAWLAFKKCKFSIQKMGQVLIKVILYTAVVFILGAIYRIDSELTMGAATMGYSVLLFREFLSVIKNIELIRPKTIPRWFIRRLEQFDDEGKLIHNGTESRET